MNKMLTKLGLTSLALLPSLAMAAPAVADKADNAFMMICTALVLFMSIPGIALFYGGLIRSKNVLSMLTQVAVTFSLVCVLWVVYGYSLAFSEGNAFFGSFNWAMLKNIALTAVMGTFINIFTSRSRHPLPVSRSVWSSVRWRNVSVSPRC